MIYEKMRAILTDQFDIDPLSITREADIINDLGLDSLDLVELILTLEEEFGITVVDDSVYEQTTMGEIADYIESML